MNCASPTSKCSLISSYARSVDLCEFKNPLRENRVQNINHKLNNDNNNNKIDLCFFFF